MRVGQTGSWTSMPPVCSTLQSQYRPEYRMSIVATFSIPLRILFPSNIRTGFYESNLLRPTLVMSEYSASILLSITPMSCMVLSIFFVSEIVNFSSFTIRPESTTSGYTFTSAFFANNSNTFWIWFALYIIHSRDYIFFYPVV
jgi:hypothetical protein